jgi:hypothetical protein
MKSPCSTYLKNTLSVIALVLPLAALQSPLWRPVAAPQCVTARVGATVVFSYDREIDGATIFQKRLASLSLGGPGRLMIHGNAPGKTNLLIRYKDGGTKLFEIVVLPG